MSKEQTVQYWKKHKDGYWIMYTTEGKTPKIKETVEMGIEWSQHRHTFQYKGVSQKHTSWCGYDRGPGRQKKLDKFWKIVESL